MAFIGNGAQLTDLDAGDIASGTLAVGRGGTGQSTYTNGQLLIGNTTGNTLTKATITAGSGISVTNGAGAITIAATTSGISAQNCSYTGSLVESGGLIMRAPNTVDLGSNRVMAGLRFAYTDQCGSGWLTLFLRGYTIKNTA